MSLPHQYCRHKIFYDLTWTRTTKLPDVISCLTMIPWVVSKARQFGTFLTIGNCIDKNILNVVVQTSLPRQSIFGEMELLVFLEPSFSPEYVGILRFRRKK
jgi:hypothetical protein